jgi:hypothetical protein
LIFLKMNLGWSAEMTGMTEDVHHRCREAEEDCMRHDEGSW